MPTVTTILEEDRSRDSLITLEKTAPGGESWGRYRVKTVKLQYFNSEAAAREAYEKTLHPRKTAKTPAAPAETTTTPKKRGRKPKT